MAIKLVIIYWFVICSGLFARRDAMLQRQMEDMTKSKAEREELEEKEMPDR